METFSTQSALCLCLKETSFLLRARTRADAREGAAGTARRLAGALRCSFDGTTTTTRGGGGRV